MAIKSFGDNHETCNHKNTTWAFPEGKRGNTHYSVENIICKDCGEVSVDGKKECNMRASREQKKKNKYEKGLEVFK
jgi:hypothetical protein